MEVKDAIEVIEDSRGFLTVAKRYYFRGEIVVTLDGVEAEHRTKYTVQLEFDKHILPYKLSGKYINHSCHPNLFLNSNGEFIAQSNINLGDEITFDYETTEDEIAEKFTCFCGSENCRGQIVGRNKNFD